MEIDADAPARPHVVLVGMMGSGKSSVARRLAKRTARRAVDVDAEIERAAGCTISQLFADHGEEAFRERESAMLASVLATNEPLVVATGGGVVLRSTNRRLLRERGRVVWLRAQPATLLQRVGDGSSRPLLSGDPLANLTRIADERRALYEAAAHEVVDVDGLSFDAITDRVLVAAGLGVSS